MSARPLPPFLPESAEAFKAHAAEHIDDWYEYFQNAYAYAEETRELLSQVKEENQFLCGEKTRAIQLEEENRSLREEKIFAAAQIANLKQQLEEKDEKIIKVSIDARLAQQASLPTVRVLTPDASKTQPAEDPTATRLGTTSPPATESAASTRLSEKLPDPDKFTGMRSDLRRFAAQIRQKLTTNRDRFPDPQSRMSYVTGRLAGTPYAQVLPYIVDGKCKLPDYEAVLSILENAYGDPNRVRNAQNALCLLRQKNQDFAPFLAEFRRLALEGEMPEESLPVLLDQAISSELRNMLLHHDPPSREFNQYAAFLQGLENRLQQHDATYRPPSWRNPNPNPRPNRRAKTPSPHRGRSPPTPRAAAPAGDPMDLSNQRRSWGPNRRENNLCFRCGSSSHFIRDCHKPDARKIQIRSATYDPSSSPTYELRGTPDHRLASASPVREENEEGLS